MQTLMYLQTQPLQRWLDGQGVLLAEEFVLFPLQDDRAGMAGSVPKLGLSGLGDGHSSGEWTK